MSSVKAAPATGFSGTRAAAATPPAWPRASSCALPPSAAHGRALLVPRLPGDARNATRDQARRRRVQGRARFLSFAENTADRLKAFLKESAFGYEVVPDSQEILRSLGVRAVPYHARDRRGWSGHLGSAPATRGDSRSAARRDRAHALAWRPLRRTRHLTSRHSSRADRYAAASSSTGSNCRRSGPPSFAHHTSQSELRMASQPSLWIGAKELLTERA